MASYTRRSHIVRIHQDGVAPAAPGQADTGVYADVEILDAISFRGPNGQEMILSFDAQKATPYIEDNTGDGQQKTNQGATRRSHMKRITGDDPTQYFDAEIMDIIAFRGPNGQEYILNLPAEGSSLEQQEGASNEYNTTTGAGDNTATRRVHNEKIYLGDKADKKYCTVTRVDQIAFRTINGNEMIIDMKSSDDTGGTRASTYVSTPMNYDPTDNSPNAVVPPKNTDPNVYVFIPKKSTGLATMSTRVAMGPLWWIRKIGGGASYYLTLRIIGTNNATSKDIAAPALSYDVNDAQGNPQGITIIDDQTQDSGAVNQPDTVIPGLYFVFPNGAVLPTSAQQELFNYQGIYSVSLDVNASGGGLIFPPGANGDGFYTSVAAAEAGAAYIDRAINERRGEDGVDTLELAVYPPNGGSSPIPYQITYTGVSVVQADPDTIVGGSSHQVIDTVLLKLPASGNAAFTVSIGGLLAQSGNNQGGFGSLDAHAFSNLTSQPALSDVTSNDETGNGPIPPDDFQDGDVNSAFTFYNDAIFSVVVTNVQSTTGQANHLQVVVSGGGGPPPSV